MYICETVDEIEYELPKTNAIKNRQHSTQARDLLWLYLEGRQSGHKLRRQHIIGQYTADFINLKYKLIVEIDGRYRFNDEQVIRDEERTRDLEQWGYTVVRPTNKGVFNYREEVIQEVKETIMVIDSHNTTQTDDSLINTPSNSQTNAQPTIRPQQAGTSPLSGGLRGAGAWAIDAACSGNSGPMEYQYVDLQAEARVLRFSPVIGTNNIGEFPAIIHVLAPTGEQGIKDKVIHSDFYNAILWMGKKCCKTTLTHNANTEQLHRVISRAEHRFQTHRVTIPIIRWETKQWGEIPASFGRE